MANVTTNDVVVVGSGAAGLGCALAAESLGLESVVLEKALVLGGGTAISSGCIWVGANHVNAREGGSDSVEDVRAYLRYVGADGIDAARMNAFVEHAPSALQFFEISGIPFQLTARLDHFHGVAPGGKAGGRIVEPAPIEARVLREFQRGLALPAGPLFRLGGTELARLGGANNPAAWAAAVAPDLVARDVRGAGAGLVAWLVHLALERGITFITGVRADRLLTEAGRIIGVAAADGRTFMARRGVVLACGGYESNPDLVANYESLPGFQSMFPQTMTGDGLVMASEIGAAVKVIANNHSTFLGFRNPDEAPGGTAVCRLSGTAELPARHTIVVNRFGRRFADETFFQAIVPSLHAFDMRLREHSNLPCFLIFDQQYARAYSFAGQPPGAAIPEWVTRADTLHDLAVELGIDGAGLAATVERFNPDAAEGRDSAFHRGETPWGLVRFTPATTIGPITEPPFHGIRLHPTALSSAGLHADVRGRALHVRGHAIAGLYAIGNAAARDETGSGYQTGYSLGSALTFGWLAARDMAEVGLISRIE